MMFNCYVFLDPFSLEVNFNVIVELSKIGANILFILVFPLNKYYDYNYYLKDSLFLFSFLDNEQQLHSLFETRSNVTFFRSLVKYYRNHIENIGYKTSGFFQKIKSTTIDTSLVYIGYFSRRRLSAKNCYEVQKINASQFELFNQY